MFVVCRCDGVPQRVFAPTRGTNHVANCGKGGTETLDEETLDEETLDEETLDEETLDDDLAGPSPIDYLERMAECAGCQSIETAAGLPRAKPTHPITQSYPNQ